MQRKVFVCIPTYRESDKVRALLESLRSVRYTPFEVIIINANPGDLTSEIIRQEQHLVNYMLHEEAGSSDQYWSGTINRGLRRVLKCITGADWVMLMNVDITFNNDIVSMLLEEAAKRPACQIGALAHANGKVISSGVQVCSWAWTINRHLFAGFCIETVSQDVCVEVDFLPTRCLLFPGEALIRAGFMQETLLPHYGADYEFTRRLSQLGYKPYLYSKVRIQSDVTNTGQCTFSKRASFLERLCDIGSIKNPANLKYRINFILSAYPKYAVLTAIFMYALRTFLEVFLGGEILKYLLPTQERGFSK